MNKRSLFNELMEGVQDMQAERQGKITLRTFTAEVAEPPRITTITADAVLRLRDRLNVSRAVFARYLRTNARTVEGWEQGRSKPNAQAAILLKLVERHPELLAEIAML